MNPPLILASQSPRRRWLLEKAGYEFRVQPPSPGAEGSGDAGASPTELVSQLAWRKAQDVAPSVDHGIVIGCDTVAECKGHILGKPSSREHAGRMLRLMRGSVHRVFSGLCLWSRPDNTNSVRSEVTILRMDDFSEDSLQSYLDSGAWVGKAGAFGYQDDLDWVHIEEGSESNVVGLPLELFKTMLHQTQWRDAT